MHENALNDADINEALTALSAMGLKKLSQPDTENEKPKILNLADAPSGEIVQEMHAIQQQRDFVAWQATEEKARSIRLQGNIKRREAQLRASYKAGVIKDGTSVDDVCQADEIYTSLLLHREVSNQKQVLLDRWAEQLAENQKVLARVLEARRQEMELQKMGIIANRPQPTANRPQPKPEQPSRERRSRKRRP